MILSWYSYPSTICININTLHCQIYTIGMNTSFTTYLKLYQLLPIWHLSVKHPPLMYLHCFCQYEARLDQNHLSYRLIRPNQINLILKKCHAVLLNWCCMAMNFLHEFWYIYINYVSDTNVVVIAKYMNI